MKHIIVWGFILVLMVMFQSTLTLADRGSFVIRKDVILSEPGQKAIIAYHGGEELLILETDVSASGAAKAVEFIPFPSEPTVSLAPLDCFQRLGAVLTKYDIQYIVPAITRGATSFTGDAVEVRFHQRLGAHDVTVVHVQDVTYFLAWMQEFLTSKGFPPRTFSTDETALIEDYLQRGFHFFVFDLVDVSQETSTIHPLIYRFQSSHFYYPLKTSNLFGGEGSIQLFVFSDWSNLQDRPETRLSGWVSSSLAIMINPELQGITAELGAFFRQEALLQAFKYQGPLNFQEDLWLASPLMSIPPGSVFMRLNKYLPTQAEYEAIKTFGLDGNLRPVPDVAHDFAVQGEVVIDHATGLTWHLSGSPKEMTYQDTQVYLGRLNQERWGGYTDWRLPTVQELLSLMTHEQQLNLTDEQQLNRFSIKINPSFNPNFRFNPNFHSEEWRWRWWSANRLSEGEHSPAAAWVVDFHIGTVDWDDLNHYNYVHGVRP